MQEHAAVVDLATAIRFKMEVASYLQAHKICMACRLQLACSTTPLLRICGQGSRTYMY